MPLRFGDSAPRGDLDLYIDPDTGAKETKFRADVRDALGLSWDTRNAAIFAELRRLKALDDEVKREHALRSRTRTNTEG